MSAWLDNFQMMGVKLNEGEKSLMRFAINKERERIIKLLEDSACCQDDCSFHEELKNMIELIKGEN